MNALTMKRIIAGASVFACIVIISLSGGGNNFANAVALAVLMISFWLFEIIPIYVTALFPFVLGIPLGILEPSDLTAAYGHKYVYLFFGGFVLSLGLEKWDVHKQIAYRIIQLVGNSKANLLLGFLLATSLLSMWISNTATALMMLPMATAILGNITTDKKSKFPLFLLLVIAYGASIGGMATLVGSPPNIQMAGLLHDQGINVTFFDWMKYGLPLSLILLIVTFLFFFFLLGKEKRSKIHELEVSKEPWNKGQKRVLFVFLAVVILWTFHSLIESYSNVSYTDEGVAVMGAIMLFVIPGKKESALLKWRDTRKIAWGILLLFGGGMALAKSLEINGVITAMSELFDNYKEASLFMILTMLVGIAIFGTELISNLALVSVFVPVVAVFAMNTDYSILQLCIPITLASSCAFMLPVGTPPNAIVFSSGQISINQMARYGFFLNLIALFIIVLFSFMFIK